MTRKTRVALLALSMLSASLVFGPVLVGALLTSICKGRRCITALIGVGSSLLAQVFLYGFMLIGT